MTAVSDYLCKNSASLSQLYNMCSASDVTATIDHNKASADQSLLFGSSMLFLFVGNTRHLILCT